MDKQQMNRGIEKMQASLRSSGVDINDVFFDLMREKLSGQISKDEFIRGIREQAKL